MNHLAFRDVDSVTVEEVEEGFVTVEFCVVFNKLNRVVGRLGGGGGTRYSLGRRRPEYDDVDSTTTR